MNYSNEFHAAVKNLLEAAGFSTSISSINNGAQGGNNRLFRLETEDGVFAVKQYFRQPDDARDRLKSEFDFLLYAKQAAPNMVPIPYSYNIKEGLALYEFIEGQPLKPGDITERDIEYAIKFFCGLNNKQQKLKANKLAFASEACFSFQKHLDLINQRIYRLQQIVKQTEDKDVQIFLQKLQDFWQKFTHDIQQMSVLEGIDLNSELNASQWCISPSDFGFHNALKLADGSIRFLDFEYAGWDDPAKMICDFFSQLAVPIASNYFEHFMLKTMMPFEQPEILIRRARLLQPLYEIKWCCIALNIFIPANLARRKFANPDLNIVNLKKTQLLKAQSIIKKLEMYHYAAC